MGWQLARASLDADTITTIGEASEQASWEDVRSVISSLIAPSGPVSVVGTPGQLDHILSPREIDVLRLLVDGRSNRAIAEALSLSRRTVERHVLHILTKLDVDTRTAAATWAVRHGLG